MNEIVYLPNQNETAIAFVKRVVAEQTDREPLRIVVQLLEIALGELQGRPCEVSDSFEATVYLGAPSWR